MAQNKEIFMQNTKTFASSRDALIAPFFCTILYGLLQILEVSTDCYRLICATKIIMQYFPYIRASKKPWSILSALTKPYFKLLSKCLPIFYVGNIGYDFSLLFSLEILRVLSLLFREVLFFLLFLCEKLQIA